jgi:mono/diheme cytochrome c family protein
VGLAAYAQAHPSIARGHEIAKQSCAVCHAIGSDDATSEKAVKAPSFQSIASQRGADRQDLQIFIQIPRHPMPIVHLTSDQIDDVVAYILSVK